MGIISKLISSKEGKLYLKFLVAVAILAAAIFAYSALSSVATATSAIANNSTKNYEVVAV